MRTSLYDQLREIEGFLEKRQSHPEPPYWEYEDEGENYCYDCIKARFPDEDDFGEKYGGGFETESDSCHVCATCGKLLDYTLTEYGIDSELEHFETCEFDLSNAQICYELARIAEGLCADDNNRIRRLIAVMKKAGWTVES